MVILDTGLKSGSCIHGASGGTSDMCTIRIPGLDRVWTSALVVGSGTRGR